jgi:hypothetical protein
MSDEAKMRTAAGLSKLWDGAMIKRIRSGDGNLILPGKRLSLHLMMQPIVAEALFRDPLLAGQGILSRLLTSVPDSTSGSRLYRPPKPESDAALKKYGARMLSIFERPAPTRKRNEVDPRDLPLSQAATNRWIVFVDHVEERLAPGAEFQEIRGLGNKLGEHAVRIAGVLSLVQDINAAEISANNLEAGMTLAEYYAAETNRLLGAAGVSDQVQLARRLLNWLLVNWPYGQVSLPDIYQRGLNAISDKATAAKLVGILQDHGWVEKIPQGATIAGKYRRDAWRIILANGTEKPDGWCAP